MKVYHSVKTDTIPETYYFVDGPVLTNILVLKENEKPKFINQRLVKKNQVNETREEVNNIPFHLIDFIPTGLIIKLRVANVTFDSV